MKQRRVTPKRLLRHTFGPALLWIMLAYLLASTSAPLAGASEEAQKRVLFLYSTRKGHPSANSAERVVQRTLSEALAGHLDFYSEYIDSQRLPEREFRLALRDYLGRTYARPRFDLIITMGGAALEFVALHGNELIPRKPVVFQGSRARAPAELGLGPNFTGVRNTQNKELFSASIDVALRLQPGIKRVFVVSGASGFDDYEPLARQQFQKFQGRLAFTYLTGLPMQDLLKTVSHLPKDSIIYYLFVAQDSAGNKFLPQVALDKISSVANAPIYSWLEWTFDQGILGGNVLSLETMAKQTAELALRVLRGEKPENIPIIKINANLNIFNWRQLQRWGISEDRLPPGSIVRFREPTFWQQYKWRIVAVLALVPIQTLLIAALLVHRTRRRRAEKRLQQLTGRLIGLQDEERKRIAAELHDGLGQSLAIIKNRATICLRDTADKERVTEQLEEISATAAATIDEVREIAHNLRPCELDRLGLTAAIESMVGKVSDSTTIRLSADLERIDGLLSSEAETSIYRIVQEGLNNVVKHSGATEARLSIKKTGREVVIGVRDNGKGVRTHVVAGNGRDGRAFGLVGIAERARTLGGSHVINSELGQGTTLIVRLGLPEVNDGR